MTQLTQHFTLAELTASNTAARLKLENTPPPEALASLLYTAEMLERIRATLGVPIIVTSGYRSPALNRAVGGVTSSDHTTGQAADIVAPRYGTPYAVASLLAPLVSTLGIGQLLYEQIGSKSWVHVSTKVPSAPRNRILSFNGKVYEIGITAIA